MIISPVENTPLLQGIGYLQKRPTISQKFGEDFVRPEDGTLAYSSMGLKGHNGIDFAVPIGTPVFAPMDGIAISKESKYGYGLYAKIRNPYKALEVTLAHLSNVIVSNNKKVYQGDLIGYSGNSGFSTGPHLHLGLRKIRIDDRLDIFDCYIEEYKNGYLGYFDPLPYLITYKGGLMRTSIYRN